MKTAKLHIVSVEFACPSCGEFISHESGSHLWSVWEVPAQLTCESCNETCKVPAKAKKLGASNPV